MATKKKKDEEKKAPAETKPEETEAKAEKEPEVKPLTNQEKAKKVTEALVQAIEGDFDRAVCLRLAKDVLRLL